MEVESRIDHQEKVDATSYEMFPELGQIYLEGLRQLYGRSLKILMHDRNSIITTAPCGTSNVLVCHLNSPADLAPCRYLTRLGGAMMLFACRSLEQSFTERRFLSIQWRDNNNDNPSHGIARRLPWNYSQPKDRERHKYSRSSGPN